MNGIERVAREMQNVSRHLHVRSLLDEGDDKRSVFLESLSRFHSCCIWRISHISSISHSAPNKRRRTRAELDEDSGAAAAAASEKEAEAAAAAAALGFDLGASSALSTVSWREREKESSKVCHGPLCTRNH